MQTMRQLCKRKSYREWEFRTVPSRTYEYHNPKQSIANKADEQTPDEDSGWAILERGQWHRSAITRTSRRSI